MLDAAVIGAGFGGLGATIGLAEQGARVVAFEALNYPGGCASTFSRGGLRLEAGATLSAGLGETGWFARTLRRHGQELRVDWPDQLVDLRIGDRTLAIHRDRERLVSQLAAEPGAPTRSLQRFFSDQRALADVGWSLLEDVDLLPPWSAASLARLGWRLLPGARFAGWPGRPMIAVLARYGLDRFTPLVQWLDGTLQVTVQCGTAEADAGFAGVISDFWWRGTGHVHGGIGELASALVRSAEAAGAEVRLADRVRSVRRIDGGWEIIARSGVVRARHLVANLIPTALAGLLGHLPSSLAPVDERVRAAWGAVMLYRVVRPPPGAGPDALHLQVVDDPRGPMSEGNHVFASISAADEVGRCPPGCRTMTISTHLPLSSVDQGSVERVQQRMRDTLSRRAPEWEVVQELTASPRTFERFTRRPGGAVGGVPRRAGLMQYADLAQLDPVEPGLWMVGDSVFLGQSTLSAAIGGARTARSIARA